METSTKSQATFDTIRHSFLELMNEMAYKKIGIGDITDRASIARQTFYTYFRSKDELLMSFMDEGFDQYFEEIQPMLLDLAQAEKVCEMLYQRFADHFPIMKMILSSDVDHLIYKRFRQYVNRTIGNVLRRLDVKVSDPKLVEFIVDHVVGSHFHMMKHWVLEEMPYTPKQMAILYTSLHSVNSNRDALSKVLAMGSKKIDAKATESK
jgi:AcrR family transcriptional regulator